MDDADTEIREIVRAIERGEHDRLTLYDGLVPLYDHLYAEEYDYEEQAAYIERAVPSGGALTLYEGGCGPGRLLVELDEQFPNAEITGVDLNEKMVERARQRTADRYSVSVARRDMRDIPHEVDVYAAFGAVTHLDIDSVESLGRDIFDALSPGGAFVFDYKTRGDDAARGEHQPWAMETDKYHVTTHFITLYATGEPQYAVSYEFEDKDTGETYYTDDLLDINHHEPAQLLDALTRAGFNEENIEVHDGAGDDSGIIIASI